MKCQKRTDVSYGNPLVAKKEQERIHELHKQRIASMKPSIDTSCPPSQPHLTTFGRDYFWKKKTTVEAAFADLKMIQSIARTMTWPYEAPASKGPTSLNATSRKQELFRITMDNHKLLNRLENRVQPVYSNKRLDESHSKNRKYLVNSSYSARKGGAYTGNMSKSRSTPAIRQESLKMIAETAHSRPQSRGQEQQQLEPPFTAPCDDTRGNSDLGDGQIAASASDACLYPSGSRPQSRGSRQESRAASRPQSRGSRQESRGSRHASRGQDQQPQLSELGLDTETLDRKKQLIDDDDDDAAPPTPGYDDEEFEEQSDAPGGELSQEPPRDESPKTAPVAKQPDESPKAAPAEIPAESPKAAPAEIPDESPKAAPADIPDESPKAAPADMPDESPKAGVAAETNAQSSAETDGSPKVADAQRGEGSAQASGNSPKAIETAGETSVPALTPKVDNSPKADAGEESDEYEAEFEAETPRCNEEDSPIKRNEDSSPKGQNPAKRNSENSDEYEAEFEPETPKCPTLTALSDDPQEPAGSQETAADIAPAATPKAEASVAATPKAQASPAATPKAEASLAATPKAEASVAATPKAEASLAATPKADASLAATPKAEASVAATPKAEASVAATPKAEASPAATPKAETSLAAPENTVAKTKPPASPSGKSEYEDDYEDDYEDEFEEESMQA